jgi:hypothetical protein
MIDERGLLWGDGVESSSSFFNRYQFSFGSVDMPGLIRLVRLHVRYVYLLESTLSLDTPGRRHLWLECFLIEDATNFILIFAFTVCCFGEDQSSM